MLILKTIVLGDVSPNLISNQLKCCYPGIVSGNVLPIPNSNQLKCCIMHCGDVELGMGETLPETIQGKQIILVGGYW